jgi:monothiol glutaredoxin
MNDSGTASRPLLDANKTTAEARTRMASYQADVIREVREAVEQGGVVVVGMAQNPHVRRVRRALDQAGIPFRYLEYGNYLSKWRVRLAIKLWSGWPTFPQVFARGVLIGGCDLTIAAIQDGRLRGMLEGS